jgi:hypothetical protein
MGATKRSLPDTDDSPAIAQLRIQLAEARAERDQAREELASALNRAEAAEFDLRESEAALRDAQARFCTINKLRLGGGEPSQMDLGGEIVPLFARILADWFDVCGGKNAVQSRVVDGRGRREFEFTMQLVGAKTPLELKAEAEAQRDNLESALQAFCGIYAGMLASDSVNAAALFVKSRMQHVGLWRDATDSAPKAQGEGL